MRTRSYDQPPDLPFSPPTQRQEAFLARNGLTNDRLDFYEASHAINRFVQSRRLLPPTERQVRFLNQHNQWHEGMNRGQAHDKIKEIVTNPGNP